MNVREITNLGIPAIHQLAAHYGVDLGRLRLANRMAQRIFDQVNQVEIFEGLNIEGEDQVDSIIGDKQEEREDEENVEHMEEEIVEEQHGVELFQNQQNRNNQVE